MKETIQGIEKAFRKKYSRLNPEKAIMEISKEEFLLRKSIAELFNQIWQLKNKKLAASKELAQLGKEKDYIFSNILKIK